MTTIECRLQSIEIKLKSVDQVVAENARLRNQLTLVENRIVALENKQQQPKRWPSRTDPVIKATITGASLQAAENSTETVDKIVSHLGFVPSDTIAKIELVKQKKKQAEMFDNRHPYISRRIKELD